MTQKRLTRDMNNKMIGGVCSGIANYLDVDPTIIRLVFTFAVLCGTIGLWVYIVALIIMPTN